MLRMRMDRGSSISSSSDTHKLEHTYTDTHNNGQRAAGQRLNRGCSTSLPLSLLISHHLSFPPLLSVNLTLNRSLKHFTTTLPFCQNTFFLLLSYFCYKTCTGCLEQQQKYNIQFVCNFLCLIIINLWGESSWSFCSF